MQDIFQYYGILRGSALLLTFSPFFLTGTDQIVKHEASKRKNITRGRWGKHWHILLKAPNKVKKKKQNRLSGMLLCICTFDRIFSLYKRKKFKCRKFTSLHFYLVLYLFCRTKASLQEFPRQFSLSGENLTEFWTSPKECETGHAKRGTDSAHFTATENSNYGHHFTSCSHKFF